MWDTTCGRWFITHYTHVNILSPLSNCSSCFSYPAKNHTGTLIILCVLVVLCRTIIQFTEPLKPRTFCIYTQRKRKCTMHDAILRSFQSQVWKTATHNSYLIYESYIYHVDINYSSITSIHITPAIHLCQWTKQFPLPCNSSRSTPNGFSPPVWLSFNRDFSEEIREGWDISQLIHMQ